MRSSFMLAYIRSFKFQNKNTAFVDLFDPDHSDTAETFIDGLILSEEMIKALEIPPPSKIDLKPPSPPPAASSTHQHPQTPQTHNPKIQHRNPHPNNPKKKLTAHHQQTPQQNPHNCRKIPISTTKKEKYIPSFRSKKRYQRGVELSNCLKSRPRGI